MSTPPIDIGPGPRVDLAFAQAAQLFDDVAGSLGSSDWDATTPCEGWTVRDVVGHATNTLETAAGMVRGEEVARDDRPGDLREWTSALALTRAALNSVDLQAPTEGPQGTKVVADALVFPTADLAVHAWDVSQAVGRPIELPTALLAHVVSAIATVPEDRLRRPGLFAPAKRVPPDCSDTVTVMGWLGRSV